jgi:N12 class adenine-specific DNA methylase/GGDEF domain-containing protein
VDHKGADVADKTFKFFESNLGEEPDNLPGQQATPRPAELPKPQTSAAAAGIRTVPASDTRRPTKVENWLPPPDLTPIFEASAREFDVPVNVLMALGHQESRYNSKAIGTQTQWGRAKGLMQYLDDTAKGLGINPFDPAQSIPAAARQIRERLDKGYSMEDAVKEHFAGPDRKLWGKKTEAYGREVMEKVGIIGDAMGYADYQAGKEAESKLIEDLNAEEPGRYRAITEADALAHNEAINRSVFRQMENADAEALAPQPAGEQPGFTSDVAHMGLGGIYKGIGHMARGVGKIPQIVGDYTTTALYNAITGEDRRTGNVLDPVADALIKHGEGIQSHISSETAQAIKESAPDGNLLEPSTWTFGKAPSVRGYAALGADVLGGMVPVVAAAVATGGASTTLRMTTSGAVGGAQGGGAAATEARNAIDKMAESYSGEDSEKMANGDPSAKPDLEKQSAYYRELVANGHTKEQALAKTRDAAEKWAFMLTAPVSAAGGMATNKLISPAEKILSGQNVAARIAGRAGLSGLEEGTQEVGEKIQTNQGINRGAGTNRNVMEGTFGDAVLGAFAGGVPGGFAGALSKRESEQRTAPPNVPPEAVPPQAQPQPQAAPAKPSGPLTGAMEAAAEADEQPPRATVTTPDGPITGFVDAYQEDGQGGFAARILGDDGQVYQFTEADGVQIAIEEPAKGPMTAAIEEAAAEMPETPEAVPEAAPVVQPASAEPVQEVAAEPARPARVERPDPATLSDDDLRTRLQYVADQFKNASARSVQRDLAKERRAIEAEIRRRREAPKPTEPAQAEFTDRTDANAAMLAAAEATDTPHEVVARDGKFIVQPIKEEAHAAAEPDGGRSDRPVAGVESADGRGTDGDGNLHGQGPGTATFAGEQAATDPVPASGPANGQPALGKDLAGAKPRYSYGAKQFDLSFASDIDRAAYIAAQKTPSKRDADYVKFVSDATGMSEAEVRAHGAKVRDAIKAIAKDAEPGKLAVPAVHGAAASATAAPANPKRAKALKRIEKGTAFFGTPEKTQAYIDEHGIGDTHEVKQTGPKKFEVVAKIDEAANQPASADDRRGATQRDILSKRINDITDPQEAREYIAALRAEILTSERTGLGSNRAWLIREPKAFVASIDLDSLKWVNDNMGHAAGDQMIAAMGDALRSAGLADDAFHVSGDEFYAQGDTETALRTALKNAQGVLAGVAIEGSGKTLTGPGFSFGIGMDLATAEGNLHEDKRLREQTGQRAARGEQPRGVAEAGRADQDTGRGEGDRRQTARDDGEAGQEVTPAASPQAAKTIAEDGAGPAKAAIEKAKAEPSLSAQLGGMSNADLSALIDEVVNEDAAVADTAKPVQKRKRKTAPKTGAPKPRQQITEAESADVADKAEVERTAGDIAKSLGYNVSSAGLEAIKGLTELFGGNGRLNSGLTFDEETYAKAKPHFKAMLADAQAAGRDLKDFIRLVLQTFGTGVKPYIIRFANDQRDEPQELAEKQNSPTLDTKEAQQNDTEATPADAGTGAEGQAAEPVRADAGGRDAGRDAEPAGRDGGTVDRAGTGTGDRGRDDAGQSGLRGRSDAADADVEQPVQGSRGDRAATGDRGNRQPRSRVSNYRIAQDELKREGSWRTTAARNVEIVELIKRLDAENRPATPEEKAQLVKFTGWGASEIANGVFPDRYAQFKPGWEDIGRRLMAALTPEEYAQAKRTTQYAHYTSESVIRSIYAGLDRLGFKGGTMLEPGMGVGHFAGLMPDNVSANSHYTGIEYDTITGKIAKHLYPASNVIIGDFTRTNLPKDFFDAAIGNPPFSQTQVLNDPEYKAQRPMLHDYFFMKTIDRVKPGGVLVFVTSKGTMDKTSDKSRKYLAERANLLGAIRLPQTAFKDNAGTEVVTDIIFLQKRGEGIADHGVQWLDTKTVQTPEGPAAINAYFADHPEMVLGRHSLQGSMYRANEYTVLPPEGDIEQLFRAAIAKLPQNVMRAERGSKAERAIVQDRDFNPKHRKEGGLYLSDDGTLMQVESGSGVAVTHRPGADGKQIALTPKQKQWLKGYVGVRDALKQAQYDQLNDGPWEQSLKALNKAYDAFVKAHGPILDYTTISRESVDDEGNVTVTETKRYKNEPLLRLDVEGALAYSLENVQEDGTIVKGAVLKERVLQRPVEPEIKTTQDALFVSLNRNGSLDLDDVAKLAGTDRAGVIADLGTAVYEAPGGQWQLADEYLSGNVVRKLKEAQAAAEIDPKYKRNVEALLAVQPRPLGPTDITVRLGANWVPASDVQDFSAQVLEEGMYVRYNSLLGSWSVEQLTNSPSEWGFDKMSAGAILESVLNSRQIKVTWRDQDGKTHTDLEATEKANDIATKMRERFRTWIWSDANRADRLVKYYNENFNNIAPRAFDGSHLTLPGVSSRFNLYPHQKRAVWRVIQQGDVYLAHAVGAGKTMEMIAAGMEERRLGLVKKPMYVVPNHMLAQFSREFLELYPAANIMVADEHNFHTHNRRRFVAQAALNNPDAIIITHSAFGRLSMSDAYSSQFIQNQIDEWKAALDDVDKSDRITTKQIERRIEQLERRLEGKQGKDKKDRVLTFEELGVDKLYVDEFHEFRKLDFATNQGNVKGVDPNGSQRALDLFMKAQYLREKNPGRALTAASGTPVTNTMGELFTVQRFFQPEQLKEDGLDTFDAWSAQYGDIVAGFEQNAAGGYEIVSRFAKFQNVPELMRRVRSFMDVLTSSNLGALVKRPDVIGGNREIMVVPAPDGYKEYQQELQRRIQAIKDRKGPPKKGEDIILNVIGDGRFSAIDLRFVDPSRPSDPNSKLNRIIDDIIAAYRETADHEYVDKATGKPDPLKGSSLILFTNIGLGEQSAETRGFDMKAWIEKRFKEAGIPSEHVAFMRDHKQHSKKERLFADMREGKKRILIGGKEMETGTNVQKRLTHLFHLDAPWFPASLEQREGRIIRQGNQNPAVKINAYATKGSYDSTMWGMLARKMRFIEQAMNGDDTVRAMEDVSEASAFEMASALASGDERYMRLAGLKADVEKLERLRHAHYHDQNSLRRQKHWAEETVKRNQTAAKEVKAAIAKRTPIRAGEFLAKVGNKPFDKRDEFSLALFERFKTIAEDNRVVDGETIGEIGGFAIKFYGAERKGSGYMASLHVDLPGDPDPLTVFPIDPGAPVAGIATRAANQVNGLDRDLASAEGRIDEAKRQIEQIGKRLGAPFPEEALLMEKVAELNALEAELAAEGEQANADAAAATVEAEGQGEQDAGEAPRYSVTPDGKPEAEFGPVHTEYRNDPAGAIRRLMADKTGEAIVNHPDLGEISLIYGDGRAGLSHIAERRGEDFLKRLPKLFENGTVYTKPNQPGRVFLGNDRKEATIRLDWNGQAKTWLVSAYEKYPDLKEGNGQTAKRSQTVADRIGMNTGQLKSALTRGVIGPVLARLIEHGTVSLHASSKTLPEGMGRNVRGIQAVTMPDGSIHMVASSLNPANARAVLLHEMFHRGGRRAVGSKQWSELMGRGASLYRQSEKSSGKAREFFDRARERVAAAKRQNAVSTRMEVEEFLAYAIEEWETAPDSLPAAIRKWVEDFIGFVKAVILKQYGKQIGELTPAQVAAIAKFALMDVASERRGEMFGPLGELFSVDSSTIEVDGKSRPTRNSNGQPIAQTEEGVRNFWRWFGDSKVVDAEGRPLVVYHGTTSGGFEVFKANIRKGEQLGFGIHFAEDPAFADRYANDPQVARKGKKPHVFNAYLSLTNPLTANQVVKEGSPEFALAKKLAGKNLYTVKDDNGVPSVYLQNVIDSVNPQKAEKAIREAGYDGVIYKSRIGTRGVVGYGGGTVTAESQSIIVFSPTQIKSATGNDGTFDPTNPDIRYSVAPEAADQALKDAAASLDEAPAAKPDYIGSVTGDLSLWSRLLVHPRTIAAIFPKFARVYRTAISQMETRDANIADLGADVEAYSRLDQKGKEAVNKVLELGRLTSSVFTDEQLADGVANTGTKKVVTVDDKGRRRLAEVPISSLLTGAGEVVTLSPDEINAYRDLRKMFDRALDMMRDQTLEEYGFPELAGEPNAAKAIRDMIADAKSPAEAERLANMARFVSEIEQAKRAGYVPLARYGDYVVTVKEKIADLHYIEDDADHLIITNAPDSFAADLMDMGAEQVEEGWRIQKGQKKDVERLTEQTIYSAKIETGLPDLLAVSKTKRAGTRGDKEGAKVHNIPAVKKVIDQAQKDWVDGHPNRRLVAFPVHEKQADGPVKLTDVDALAEIAQIDNATWDAVRDKLSDAIKSRSFRKHFFHSDNVPGYTGDFERAIADYVIGMSGYLSRRKHIKQWENSISAITDQPKLFEYASKYRDYVNNPQEELAMVRQIGFFSYIAGVMASAFANLTQVPMLTVPTLSQLAPVPLVLKETARAYKDALAMMGRPARVGLDMFDPDKAPADLREIIKQAWSDGAFVPLETFDLMMTARQRNVGQRKGVKAFNKATQVVALGFTFAERLNRLTTFIAAARLAEKPAVQKNAKKVLAKDALARQEVLANWNAKDFAEWTVDETQYRMGKANRPTTMRGVGSAIMQFKGFMLQTFEAWYRMVALHGKEGKFAAAASLGTLFAFAGLWGMPGADDLRALIEAIYRQITNRDLDMKTELRAWLYRTSGSNAIAQMVSKGVPYATTGVDMTRVGLGSVAPDSALAAAGIPFDLLIGRPSRAFQKGAAGDYWGAAGEMSPNALKHWLVAGGWAADGVRDKYGNRILNPQDLSDADIMMKALGFQPSIVTDVRDYEYAQRRQETAVDAMKRRYLNQIARTIAGIETAEDPDTVRELEAKLAEIYAEIEAHNAEASEEQIIQIGQRALRNRFEREMGGVQSTWGRERKQARGAAQDLREVFGLADQDDE